MSITYSLFKNQLIESECKPDIYSVLEQIPNNTNKLISPKDVRDAFLSSWANAIFKITKTNTGQEYIGIDSGNPENRDVKKKILLGKRSIGSQNVISDDLIENSDTDIFFFNTKSDDLSQDSTKLSILAGTDSSLFNNAPYIESVKDGNKINLNIKNEQEGATINIVSEDGRIYINGIGFPTLLETQNSLYGDVLKYIGVYPYGKLEWITEVEQEDVDWQFIDDNLVPITIGGVTAGSSFPTASYGGENWPVVEVVRQILYPYLEPILEFNLYNLVSGNKYAEVGTVANLSFTYSITSYPRNANEYVSFYFIRDNGTQSDGNIIATFSGIEELPGYVEYGSYSTHSVSSATQGYTMDFAISVSNINPAPDPLISLIDGFSYSLIDTLTFISPFLIYSRSFLYPFSNAGISSIREHATKIVEPKPDEYILISCTASNQYIYFCYPEEYGELSNIYDPNGFIIHDKDYPLDSSFTYSLTPVTPNSPYEYYGQYIMYRTKNMVSYLGTGSFKFIF